MAGEVLPNPAAPTSDQMLAITSRDAIYAPQDDVDLTFALVVGNLLNPPGRPSASSS